MKKAQSQINRLLITLSINLAIFIGLAAFLLNFIIENYPVIHFMIAGGILLCFVLLGILGSISQISQALNIDYTQSVTECQEQLEKLKAYNLQTLRLLFLSIPFYFAYIIIGFKVWMNVDIYSSGNTEWLMGNLILSILFIPLSIWIYRVLNYHNARSWVRRMIADNGGRQIQAALGFLNEIDELKGGK